MKDTIKIRQKPLSEITPTIGLVCACYLDIVYWMCMSTSERIEEKRISIDGEKYTWISYSYLISENPLLRAKTGGALTPVFKKLEILGYIRCHIEPTSRRKYICLTAQTHLIYSTVKHKEAD